MKTIVAFLLLPGWLLSPGFIHAQINQNIPRDTTYTLRSTTVKLRKDFPFIKPVKEFCYGDILSDRDLVYRTVNDRELHLDIFRPNSSNIDVFSCIICIHGGGWASGNKSLLVPMAQELVKNGFVAVSVEYRLSPESKYPAGVIDVKNAIKWLKINATSFNIDTNRIAILGTSAGATIASLVGNTGEHPLYKTSFPDSITVTDRVQAIVNIDGILDFSDPAESGKDLDPAKPSAAARWFGSIFKEDPEPWLEASPLRYAGTHSPPTLFINSAVPRFHAGRDAYMDILHTHGILSELHTIPDSPHSFWLFDPWFDMTIEYIEEFVNSVL